MRSLKNLLARRRVQRTEATASAPEVERVWLPRTHTNIHLVGGAAYKRTHGKLVELTDDMISILEQPYRAVERGRARGWLQDLAAIEARQGVPMTDQPRVAAASALARLLLLGCKRGPATQVVNESDAPEAVELVEDVLRHVAVDRTLHEVLVVALWVGHRLRVPVSRDLVDRALAVMPRLGELLESDEERSWGVVFARAALEVERLWEVVKSGSRPDPQVASPLWRLLKALDGANGSLENRRRFLYLQACVLDDLAHGNAADSVAPEWCTELRDAVGHTNPLAVEIHMLSESLAHGWAFTWVPQPAWRSTFARLTLRDFLRTNDAVEAMRYLLTQAERAMHHPTEFRIDEFERLANLLITEPRLERFPLEERHRVIVGTGWVGKAYHLRLHNRTFHARGPGRETFGVQDLIARPFIGRPEFKVVQSLHYAEFTDGSVDVTRVHPRFDATELGVDIPGLTPVMALTIGRQERSLLSFLVEHMSWDLPGEFVEQRIALSLASLEYAADHLRDADEPTRLHLVSEILETINVARSFAMPIDTLSYFDLVEGLASWREPGRGQLAVDLGHLGSGDTVILREHSARLREYWEVGLTDLRRHAAEVDPTAMVSVLANTAVSLNIHARHSGQPVEEARSIVGQALALVHEAVERIEESGSQVDAYTRCRTYACAAWLTQLREEMHRVDIWDDDGPGLSGDLAPEAVAYQDLAYEHLPREPVAWQEAVNSVMDLLVPVDAAVWPEAAARFEELLLAVIRSRTAEIRRVIEAVTRLTSHYRVAGKADQVARPLLELLPRMDELARLPLPLGTLRELQGVISAAAVAECRAGRIESAVHIIETGTGRILETLSGGTVRRAKGPEGPREVVGATGRPLVYLVSGDDGGAAILFRPDGQVRHLLVDELDDSWRHLFDDDEADAVAGEDQPEVADHLRGVLRAEPDTTPPGPEQLFAVLDRMATVLVFVADGLGLEATRQIDLVPVGGLSRLPWQAAFGEAGLGLCATQSSALSLGRANQLLRGRGGSRGFAITSPRPSVLGGRALPDLDRAAEEGTHLESRYGAEHRTGAGATRAGMVEGLSAGFRRFVHVAVHGAVQPHSWDASYLVFAPSDQEADDSLSEPYLGQGDEPSVLHHRGESVLAISDLVAAGMRTDLAFLAACWSASPNRALPEEAISFPTAALRAGARCVIAPLWPIHDIVARDFVIAFYDQWLGQGATLAEAFQVAAQAVREAHPQSTTWAAFTIHGAAFSVA